MPTSTVRAPSDHAADRAPSTEELVGPTPHEEVVRQEAPGRETAAEEALRWIPLYTAAFGPLDADALPHWTIVRFPHDEPHMSLAEIASLAGGTETPDGPTVPVRDHT
ncbi:hypothetical protein GCM10017667_00960 [Streptomyces filamentosus]|uniref:Uncharacterized protein n=1 Tax=Streptomyces filamentosus TaxID=67294 RepID=A0A919BBL9_STRFL|nr:hypothetical protein GCM10017667_00960 [Streptomyces filamentosus]